jgi:hypothetical protein
MTNDPRESNSKRRRWYLGIQSKKDPAHVMTEVFKAMQLLNCLWYPVNQYRVLCLWIHVPNANISPIAPHEVKPVNTFTHIYSIVNKLIIK